jgi:hypothetical protein
LHDPTVLLDGSVQDRKTLLEVTPEDGGIRGHSLVDEASLIFNVCVHVIS